MVFSTAINFVYSKLNRGPPKIWGYRRMLRHSAHFKNRNRNCIGIAIRELITTFKHCSQGRKHRARDLHDLNKVRLDAGCQEHGIDSVTFTSGLERSLILLSVKSLANLAIWEPRTFKALTDVAKARVHEEPDLSYKSMDVKDVSHFIHRGLLFNKNSK